MKAKIPLMIGAVAFSFSMVLLWATRTGEVDRVVIYVGVAYALICLSFLFF